MASGAGVGCCPQSPITVKLVRLDFLGDHGLLKDAWKQADGTFEWRDTGTPYSHPDWVPAKDSNPVSYSMVKSLDANRRDPVGGDRGSVANRERMKVKVYLEIGGDACACPDLCYIRGVIRDSQGKRLTLFRSGRIALRPAAIPREIEMTAKVVLPRRILQRELTISWVIRSSSRSANPSFPRTKRLARTRHRRLLTFAKPITGRDRESGVTLARMRRSIEWIGDTRTTDHRTIISHLFGKFDSYTLVDLKPKAGGYDIDYSNLSKRDRETLKNDPALLKRLGDLGWSSYFKAPGAWPAADPELVAWGAECQAICRLAAGMLRQLGSDADVEVVLVWADFSKPNKPIVKKMGTSDPVGPTGPDGSKGYVLVDVPVEKGKLYIAPLLDPKDGKMKVPADARYRDSNSVGWNNFEAYARYRYETRNGKTRERFYGGGVGEHSGNLVHVFQGIAEYESRSATVWRQSVSGWFITGYYDYDAQRYL